MMFLDFICYPLSVEVVAISVEGQNPLQWTQQAYTSPRPHQEGLGDPRATGKEKSTIYPAIIWKYG